MARPRAWTSEHALRSVGASTSPARPSRPGRRSGRFHTMLEAGNLWELIERRAEATPEGQLAVDHTGRATTFADYVGACQRAAAGLQGLGIGEGSVVSWQLPTWIESMVLVGALSRLSALQNPILPILREREVEFIVRQARSKLLIVPSTFRDYDFEAMARGIAADANG